MVFLPNKLYKLKTGSSPFFVNEEYTNKYYGDSAFIGVTFKESGMETKVVADNIVPYEDKEVKMEDTLYEWSPSWDPKHIYTGKRLALTSDGRHVMEDEKGGHVYVIEAHLIREKKTLPEAIKVKWADGRISFYKKDTDTYAISLREGDFILSRGKLQVGEVLQTNFQSELAVVFLKNIVKLSVVQ